MADLKDTKKPPRSLTYRSWDAMIHRCTRPSATQYSFYGGRGISVCERWKTYANFLADVGERPSKRHSLDRYPNKNGNYEPGNVRWATAKEQANNTRRTRNISALGQTLSLQQWADRTGINCDVIYQRLKHGWSPERAVTIPVRQIKQRAACTASLKPPN